MATTGNIVLASYVSSATEAILNEAVSYTSFAKINGSEQKALTSENLSASFSKTVSDTIVNGTVLAATGKIAGRIVPTNKGWIKPTKFSSSFVGKYAQKSIAQTAVQGGLYAIRNIVRHYAAMVVK